MTAMTQLSENHPSDLALWSSTQSLLMKDIYNKMEKLAELDNNVVVVGETGAGKKWVTRKLHARSGRSGGPFHMFYCVDIDETEYKDAFWEQIRFEEDHITLRYDAIERASGGTLYLDQFSELPLEFMRQIIQSYVAGCRQLFRFDKSSRPRLILSVKQESYSQLIQTQVWEEVLELLEPISITVPPLRERREDIPLYTEHFLQELKQKFPKWHRLSLSPDLLDECVRYHWPGNVRQLKNAILQGAVLSYGSVIEQRHMPFSLRWKLPYESGKDEVSSLKSGNAL
jgi:DNA-binding NtrC family response regulator